MTSKPASRRARATIFAPRSWPSRPGFATITRYFCGIAASVADPRLRPGEPAAQDAIVDLALDTRYATTPDGASIAYRTFGEGSVDIVWQADLLSNFDVAWEYPPERAWLAGLATFARVIVHDRRGTGASSRNVTAPNLETRVADLKAVLDAVGSDRSVLGADFEGGAPNV